MTDLELIGYCEMHCKTERALFHADQVARMMALAGRGEGKVIHGVWHSMHEEMEDLCKAARRGQALIALTQQAQEFNMGY